MKQSLTDAAACYKNPIIYIPFYEKLQEHFDNSARAAKLSKFTTTLDVMVGNFKAIEVIFAHADEDNDIKSFDSGPSTYAWEYLNKLTNNGALEGILESLCGMVQEAIYKGQAVEDIRDAKMAAVNIPRTKLVEPRHQYKKYEPLATTKIYDKGIGYLCKDVVVYLIPKSPSFTD